MKISVIVAMAEGRVIGRGGSLPWHLSADLKRFKQLTMGHAIVMGRKTCESIGRPLPGRTSIVITRQSDYGREGVLAAASLEEALRLVPEREEVFVIGGAQIYEQALPLADRLYVTRVHAAIAGDTFFPDYNQAEWRLVESETHAADEKNPHAYTFEIYQRVRL